jgi:hypothetical protein
MANRKLTAWDLVDEVLTEMTDQNFRNWASERLGFRSVLIAELKDYIKTENIEIVNTELEGEN